MSPRVIHSGAVVTFDYVNWRGDEHRYEIVVEGIGYGVHGDIRHGNEEVWQLHGYVLNRDGELRPEMGNNRRRSFILNGVTNATWRGTA